MVKRDWCALLITSGRPVPRSAWSVRCVAGRCVPCTKVAPMVGGITRRRLDWVRRAPHRHVLSDRATDECFEVLASIDRTPSGAHPEGFAMPSPKMYPTPASASAIVPIHTAARRHDRQAPYPHTVSAVKNYTPATGRICGLSQLDLPRLRHHYRLQ
ncbi:MAG: hypothetical protein QOJ06_1229 [Pseudonocardiales bacterium]|jgi:hypothetical protein|nr:hypothetical protein [Pseudonocardiales bacterium]